MKRLLLLLLIITSVNTFSQSSFKVSGNVISMSDGETVFGALVRVKETGKATTSNFSGGYQSGYLYS